MEVNFATGAKVSLKSYPSTTKYPLATSLAFQVLMFPAASL